MTMEWKEILSAIDADKDLSKDNVIEKIKPSTKMDETKEAQNGNGNGNVQEVFP